MTYKATALILILIVASHTWVRIRHSGHWKENEALMILMRYSILKLYLKSSATSKVELWSQKPDTSNKWNLQKVMEDLGRNMMLLPIVSIKHTPVVKFPILHFILQSLQNINLSEGTNGVLLMNEFPAASIVPSTC